MRKSGLFTVGPDITVEKMEITFFPDRESNPVR